MGRKVNKGKGDSGKSEKKNKDVARSTAAKLHCFVPILHLRLFSICNSLCQAYI